MKWPPKGSYPNFLSSPLVFKSRLHTNTLYSLAPNWGITFSSSYVAVVKKHPQGMLCATIESERSLTKIKFITLHLSVRPGTRLMDSRCFIAPWLLRVTLLFDRSLSIIQNQQKKWCFNEGLSCSDKYWKQRQKQFSKYVSFSLLTPFYCKSL